MVGSNRSGKTTCGALEDISFWLGFRPWTLPEDLKQVPIQELLNNPKVIPQECRTPIQPPVKVLIVVADWEVADDIWTIGTSEALGKLAAYIPPAAIAKTERNNMGHICRYHCINGSVLELDTQKSFINDPQSFEGRRLDLAHYDEPPRRDLRVAVRRGLVDRFGYEIFTLTPLTEPWIKSEIFDKAPTSNGLIECFHLRTEENPYVSQEGWKAFLASLTEDEKDARGKGLWVHLKGLVYPEFDPRPAKDGGHLIGPLPTSWVRQNCSVYVSIDPHPREPMTAILLAVDSKGRKFVWRELHTKDLVPEFCAKVLSRLEGIEPVRVLIDPIAYTPDPVDGLCWADEFIRFGLPVEPAPKRKEAGILRVRQALKNRELYFCTDCARTLYEIQHYVYAEWRNSENRGLKERPVDKDDHTLECLYRLMLLEPVYVGQTKGRPIESYSFV